MHICLEVSTFIKGFSLRGSFAVGTGELKYLVCRSWSIELIVYVHLPEDFYIYILFCFVFNACTWVQEMSRQKLLHHLILN